MSVAILPGDPKARYSLRSYQLGIIRGERHETFVLVAAVLGVLFLLVAGIYFLVPAGSLPSYFPGFVEGSTHVHLKHGLIALVVALALLGFAWVNRET